MEIMNTKVPRVNGESVTWLLVQTQQTSVCEAKALTTMHQPFCSLTPVTLTEWLLWDIEWRLKTFRFKPVTHNLVPLCPTSPDCCWNRAEPWPRAKPQTPWFFSVLNSLPQISEAARRVCDCVCFDDAFHVPLISAPFISGAPLCSFRGGVRSARRISLQLLLVQSLILKEA